MSPSTPSRWCPTPEQLMILEEMYRSGIRTPNASQIQQITAHLSFYGKIEGKNVFYWFQNHKARDRQKMRRKLSKQLQQQQQQLYHHHQQLQQHHQTHHNLLPCFNQSPGSSPYHQLSYYNSSAGFLAQGGVEDKTRQEMNCTWKKLDLPDRAAIDQMIEKPIMKMHGSDWMMMIMMDMAPPSSSCCKRPPLKTLELFPITASNLKEESNSSINPCSTTTPTCN